MVGLDLPVVSLQHQYLVTEAIPEIEAHGRPLPIVRDPDVSWYLRQERAGLLLGPYEWDCRLAWEGGEPPAEFGMELFEDDLDRLEPYIEDAIARVPVFGRAGITRVINGPIPYTPDGNPLLGPAYGLDDVYLACAFSFGIVQGGGAGKALAEWITTASRSGTSGRSTRAATPTSPPGATCAPRRWSSTSTSTRSPSRSRSAPRGGRPRPRRSTRRCAPRARGSARAAAGSGRPGSRRRARRRSSAGASGAATGTPRWPRSAVPCASGSASSISAALPSSRSAGRAPLPSSTA